MPKTYDAANLKVLEGLDAGMNGHVGKPLNIDEVLKILRKYLL